MNRGVWAGLVAIAFVAGSITTSTVAHAAQGGQGDNLIVNAINALTQAIVDKELDAEVTIPEGGIQVTAPVTLQGIEGPVGPQGPPGPENIYVKPIQINVVSGSSLNYFLSCDEPTDVAIGAGVLDLPEFLELSGSGIELGGFYNPSTWVLGILSNAFDDTEVSAYLICAKTN